MRSTHCLRPKANYVIDSCIDSVLYIFLPGKSDYVAVFSTIRNRAFTIFQAARAVVTSFHVLYRVHRKECFSFMYIIYQITHPRISENAKNATT